MKLPFKAVFLIEFNQDLLLTVIEQSNKYTDEVAKSISNLEAIKDIEIRKSLKHLLTIGSIKEIIPKFLLSL